MSGLGVPLGFPLGDGDATTVVDHVTVGKDRLLYQFQGESHPLIQALVEAPLQASAVLDQLGADLKDLRWLANAEGEQLDVVGAILGCEREDRSDALYRTAIEATLLVLRSNGSIDEILAPLEVYEPGNDASVDDLKPLDPAAFRLSMTDPILDDTKAERYRRVIAQSRAAGVRVWFYSHPAPEAGLFWFDNDGAGAPVVDFDHGFNCGVFAREEIA